MEYINKTNDILTLHFSGFLFLSFALLGILGLTCTPLSWLLAVASHTRNCFCILQNLSISPNSHWLWKNFYPSWNFITWKSNKPYHSATIKICLFTRWLDFCKNSWDLLVRMAPIHHKLCSRTKGISLFYFIYNVS